MSNKTIRIGRLAKKRKNASAALPKKLKVKEATPAPAKDTSAAEKKANKKARKAAAAAKTKKPSKGSDSSD